MDTRLMSEIIGSSSVFAFEVHPATEGWQVRTIQLWIRGQRLYAGVCHVPSFLQMAQRFLHKHREASDRHEEELCSGLSDEECYERWRSYLPPFERFAERDRWMMHGFDEATDEYTIICLSDRKENRRIVWCGMPDASFIPAHHCGHVFGALIPSRHFHGVYHDLFRYFGADIMFSDVEWSCWWNRQQELARRNE